MSLFGEWAIRSFLQSAMCGDVSRLREAVASLGPGIADCTDMYGFSALHYAARGRGGGAVRVARFLLEEVAKAGTGVGLEYVFTNKKIWGFCCLNCGKKTYDLFLFLSWYKKVSVPKAVFFFTKF